MNSAPSAALPPALFPSLRLLLALVLPSLLPVPGVAGGKGQATLPIVVLEIGGKSIRAEVADEDAEREWGLMFREELEPDAGMLFVMPGPGPATFWMKNTPLPLSIGYIGPDGTLLEIHDLEPFNETPVKSRFPNIAYALEMRRGWFSDNLVFPGTRIRGLPGGGPAAR